MVEKTGFVASKKDSFLFNVSWYFAISSVAT